MKGFPNQVVGLAKLATAMQTLVEVVNRRQQAKMTVFTGKHWLDRVLREPAILQSLLSSTSGNS